MHPQIIHKPEKLAKNDSFQHSAAIRTGLPAGPRKPAPATLTIRSTQFMDLLAYWFIIPRF